MAKNVEMMMKLFTEYGLTKEDTFKHQHYSIITRGGIDKIQAKANVVIDYEVIKCEPKFAVLKATAKFDDRTIQTFGEAAPDNCKNTYYMAMAEKRAMSRAVLKLVGLYELGVFGEDEADDFSKSKNSQSTSNNLTSAVKNQIK